MQKIVPILFFSALFAVACTHNPTVVLHGPQTLKGKVFGDSITDQGIKDVAILNDLIEENSVLKLKLAGTVENVCPKNGCWLTMKLNDGQLLWVTFKDHAFHVPKNIVGKKVVIQGEAKSDSEFIADEQHLTDINLSEKQLLDRSNAQEQSLTFEAKGLVVL